MKLFHLNPLIFLILFFAAGCDSTEPDAAMPDEPLRTLTTAEQQIISSDNAFGFRLFQNLHTEAPGENLFISPFSVSMALGMTLNGADGSTRADMEEALTKSGLSETEINESYRALIDLLSNLDPSVAFDIANSIWSRTGFPVESAFLDVNQTYFDAEVQTLDFADPEAVPTINNWVTDKTRGKIDKIIDRIAPDVVMYLINAIYFKGAWQYQFDPDNTHDAPFFNLDGSTTTVPMMQLEAEFPMLRADTFSAVDLPYGDSLYSMTILLPHPDVSLDDLIAQLDTDTWNDWTESFTPSQTTVYLPRFTLEYQTSLVDALTALGMGIAFTDAADFSRINGTGGLKISDVIHKTFVEVNEEGTEAAAVTAVIIVETSLPPGIRVDRPFVFMIRERHSGTILFTGKVTGL